MVALQVIHIQFHIFFNAKLSTV